MKPEPLDDRDPRSADFRASGVDATLRTTRPRSPGHLRAIGLACVLGLFQPCVGLAQPGGGGDVTITEPAPSPNRDTPRDRRGPEDRPPSGERAGQGEIDLRPKFESGRKTRYEYTIDHLITTGPAGQPGSRRTQPNDAETSTGSLKQRMTLTLRTVDAGDNSNLMELSIDSFSLALETDDLKLQASSDGARPAGGPPLSEEDRLMVELLERVVKSIAGTKLVMTVDARGNITSVQGGENLSMTSLVGQIAGGLGGLGGAGGLLPAGGGGGGAGGGLQWLVSGTSGQPAKARVGQTWTNADKLGNTPIGDLQMVTKHTVRSIRGSTAEIAFVGNLEPASAGGAAPGSPSTGKITQSSYRGTYTWDARSGELARMSGQMQSELEAGGADGTKTRSVTRMDVERLAPSAR